LYGVAGYKNASRSFHQQCPFRTHGVLERKQLRVREWEVRVGERLGWGWINVARAVGQLEVISRSGGVGFEVASEPLAKMRKRLNELAATELRSIRENAAALVAKKRYGAAAALFSEYPNYLRGLPGTEEIDAEGPRIKRQARADWNATRLRVAGLMAAFGRGTGALDESREVLMPFVRRTGMADIESEAKALREQVEARAKDVSRASDDRATKVRMAEAEAVVAEALLLEHGYHFDDAAKLLRRAESLFRQLGKGSRANDLVRRIEAIARPEILFDMLLDKAIETKLAKHTVAVPGGPSGRVVGARKDSGEFFVRAGSGTGKRVKWSRFPPGEIIKLFRAMAPTADDRLKIAGFALDHGLVSEAKKELLYANRIRAENVPLARILKFRVKIGAPTSPDAKDAKTLADLALSAASKGSLDRARELLDLLKTRYAETDAARTRADEIAEAIAAVSAESKP
jgi:hypothetical protein